MNIKYTRLLQIAPLAVLITALNPLASYAGFFGDHPRYLHALSDMRYARALILRPDASNVVADERGAVNELNAAINEIKEASREDWKPIDDHPPIDVKLNQPGRLHEAMKVLSRAQQDLNQEEDDGNARSLRNRALRHLQLTKDFVRKAVGDKEFDRGL